MSAVRCGRRVGRASAAGFAEVATAIQAGADLGPAVADGDAELFRERAFVITPAGDEFPGGAATLFRIWCADADGGTRPYQLVSGPYSCDTGSTLAVASSTFVGIGTLTVLTSVAPSLRDARSPPSRYS